MEVFLKYWYFGFHFPEHIYKDFVNGFWKVKPEISVFYENLHKSFGFPIC